MTILAYISSVCNDPSSIQTTVRPAIVRVPSDGSGIMNVSRLGALGHKHFVLSAGGER